MQMAVDNRPISRDGGAQDYAWLRKGFKIQGQKLWDWWRKGSCGGAASQGNTKMSRVVVMSQFHQVSTKDVRRASSTGSLHIRILPSDLRSQLYAWSCQSLLLTHNSRFHASSFITLSLSLSLDAADLHSSDIPSIPPDPRSTIRPAFAESSRYDSYIYTNRITR